VRILETERLVIRECTADDGPFVLELLNSPKFLQFIGDRGVHTEEDARRYIAERFIASYREHGHGLFAVEVKVPAPADPDIQIEDFKLRPIGLCGLVRRPSLDGPDLGFAFLPEFEGRGCGTESAQAVLEHSRTELGITRVLAITTLDNEASIALLRKLGFEHLRIIDEKGEKLNLFELELE
jgi:RimJ/RimL family protein N-acetyltransferase